MDVSVVGVPDERYGEVVAAFIIPREHQEDAVTEDKIRIWVGERLSHHLSKASTSTNAIQRIQN
jgi:acyl-CoA synthetase (AMP-forming)/AMP-acid ligase II